ncbi:hypothetical protein KKH3_30770 [Pectobacterium actinidiae]|nr:hypothetical protein KKH3_30770 [Pectobacterium actinidiae]
MVWFLVYFARLGIALADSNVSIGALSIMNLSFSDGAEYLTSKSYQYDETYRGSHDF